MQSVNILNRTNQHIRQKQYENGDIMFEPVFKTKIFKLLGVHFTSNKKRNKKYSMKSYWVVSNRNSTLDKWMMIFRGEVHAMKI